MGQFICPQQSDLDVSCAKGKHTGKTKTKCVNENCMEKPTICNNCGITSKTTDGLVCKLCSIGEGGDGGESDDDKADGKSSAPNLKLQYSASRDPTKLSAENRAEGSFKVGSEEDEKQIMQGN